jgi:hypothetical protein
MSERNLPQRPHSNNLPSRVAATLPAKVEQRKQVRQAFAALAEHVEYQPMWGGAYVGWMGNPDPAAVEAPVSDADLASMTLRDSLHWAADTNERIMWERALQVARMHGYQPGWAGYVAGKAWREVY